MFSQWFKLYNKNSVAWCSPVGIAMPDGDALDLTQHRALGISVSETDMRIVPKWFPAKHRAIRARNTIVTPINTLIASQESLSPIWLINPIFLGLDAAFNHVVPLFLER